MSIKKFHEIYLDNNATTRSLPEVQDSVMGVLGQSFGNPSSAHSLGGRVRKKISLARDYVALLIGAPPSQLIFTSGGTEANNLVLSSVTRGVAKQARIITSQVEHSSVLDMCDHIETLGVEVIRLPVNGDGLVSVEDFKAALNSKVVLVSIQWVNNETGVTQPIRTIGKICRTAQVPFHTDAAQAVGKLCIDVSNMPIDFLTFTGHKFHSPQGVGALYSSNLGFVRPTLFGGTQEEGLRPGTENVPGIIGMGVAAQIRQTNLLEHFEQLTKLRKQFEKKVLELVPQVKINGGKADRVCNTSNLFFEGVDGQALVARLDQEGIYCSQSSACTNQRPEPSYVLRAMGLSEADAYSSIRFSFSIENTFEEIGIAVDKISKLCKQLRIFKN
ncbi:cysteine desulfurase family protein [Geopsychrobacter electrodiphilus]|uniref:cysteine desulfurase family protein n=1 Tax=Geopsychrobacter electrodiphilus TaxID=225196 RepID=UPI00035EB8D2|nr:cysteine desulfurase family protein [Geopsychrobacter electrodiphilus]